MPPWRLLHADSLQWSSFSWGHSTQLPAEYVMDYNEREADLYAICGCLGDRWGGQVLSAVMGRVPWVSHIPCIHPWVPAQKPLREGCSQVLDLSVASFQLFDFGWRPPLRFPRYVSISAMVVVPTLELLALADATKQVPAFYYPLSLERLKVLLQHQDHMNLYEEENVCQHGESAWDFKWPNKKQKGTSLVPHLSGTWKTLSSGIIEYLW